MSALSCWCEVGSVGDCLRLSVRGTSPRLSGPAVRVLLCGVLGHRFPWCGECLFFPCLCVSVCGHYFFPVCVSRSAVIIIN